MTTLASLVTGNSAGTREAAISSAIDRRQTTALILEGMPDGTSTQITFENNPHLSSARIAPGCICCTGNLAMRVHLNRVLRHPPARLFISLASTTHLEEIRKFLSREPYDNLLTLTKDIQA